MLLTALLGVSQGVWADNTVVSDGTYRLYFKFSGGSTWWNNTGCYHYAWVWNAGNSGQYARIYKVGTTNSASTGNTTDVFYMVLPTASNKAINRMILFRGKSSSSPADGSTTWVDDYYNKTGDVVISNNISTYNLVTAVTEGATSCTQTSNYALSPTSCSASMTGYTSGSGTSEDPYVVSVGDSYTLTLSATCEDGNLKKYYSFDGSSYSVTASKTVTPTEAGTTDYNAMSSKTLAGSSTYSSAVTSSPAQIYVQAVSSCTTPTNNDITISAPASTTTLYLGTGNTPSVTQTVTAACSKGNTYLWSATPTTYSSSSCWSSTATRVTFTSASSKSTTATFYHEGVYTATFAAGCGNATDASKNAPIITVKPGHIYFDGPFFSGSDYDLTKHHLEIDKSNDKFVYEWTATSSNTVADNDFIISVGTSCIDATSAAYTIGNYAACTLNGLVIPDKDTGGKSNCNHNFRADIGTINVGDGLKLTIAYTGVNASNVPKYSVTLEKTCSAVSKSQYTMATQSKQWTGSAITPNITRADGAGTIKNYYYSTDGSTWTSGCPTARGTYYIKIDVNAGSTYCAKDGIILDNTLKITRKSRTISIDNTDVVCGAGSYTITSTASVGSGTKTYSIKSDPSSIASIGESTGELTLTGAGTFTVQVNIAASGNYAAASGTKEFTVTLPTLSTSDATGISYTSATLNGSVSNETCTPSASGFEYKKGSDAYTSVAAASATGSISKEISGLTPGTTYTFRTYTVVNGVTKYSDTRTFSTTSCSAPIIDSSSLGAQSKCKDASGTEMSVTASGGVGTLTYTWYKKNDTTPSGGTQVQSSTSNSYTPPTGTVGTLYYYCVVSSASPCASSTVNSGISGAVEIKAKPTLTISPAGTIYNYMPMTVSSDMDVVTWAWSATGNFVSGYFTSELTRSATFKGKVVDNTATGTATFTATGTNGCNGTIEQDITKDTESCN